MSRRQATPGQSELRFFATARAFLEWLELHHDRVRSLWVGFHRKSTGRSSLTWPESVDEALCFGWIDGIRKKIDDESYKIRFTPRKAKSTWSTVNIGRVKALRREGRMQPAGLAAFRRRSESNSAVYSFENRATAKLSKAHETEFRRDEHVWEFFQAQPPGYRRIAAWWVVSAKAEDTRQRRLRRLINESRLKRRIY